MTDEQPTLHPVFDEILAHFDTPYEPVRECSQCMRLFSDHRVLWHDHKPFCSNECIADFEKDKLDE